jgi:glycosyltransferase involved in cell wall biosynthesis
MPEVYGSADVMVVASVGECPLTVLEAMSVGLPVVVNDDPALHSPWTSGPGVVFVGMAGGDLGPTLERLVGDPAATARMGRAGHELVRGSFSWEAHVTRLEEVYRNVLAMRP